MWGAAIKRGYKAGNRNRKLTKLFKIVPYECEIMHANFGGDPTTLICQSYGKETKAPKFADWLPSVLILRRL